MTRINYGSINEYFIDDKYVYVFHDNMLKEHNFIKDELLNFNKDKEYINALNEAIINRIFKEQLDAVLQ